jgi:hypothetical protein
MTDNITPPPELVQQWTRLFVDGSSHHAFSVVAQWGADMELEACCEWLVNHNWRSVEPALRAARRPEPPSLKELALEALDQADKGLNKSEWQQCSDTIRRALEQLDD